MNPDINIFDNDENRVNNELLSLSEVNESLNLTQTTQATQTAQATQATQTNFSQNSNISLGLSRTRISHSKCIICNKGGFKKSLKRVKLQLISQYTIRQTLKQKNIFIPYGSRCCSTHIKDNELNEDSIPALIPLYSHYV